MEKGGLFVGLKKGYVVTKPKENPKYNRPVSRKGKLNKRVALVREVIKEISGLAPYEKKMVELIKTGVPAREKRALKLAKARLGNLRRAGAKREELNKYLQAQKRRPQ